MKEKNKQKQPTSLLRYFALIYVVIAIILAAFLAGLLTLVILFAQTDNKVLFIAFIVLLPIFVVFIIILAFFIIRYSYNIFYTNLYANTLRNIDLLSNDSRNLNKYTINNVQEFQMLNDKLDRLAAHNETLEISSRKFDYSNIAIEYLNKKANFVKEESFRKNIREIIYCSNYLRNGVISISYDSNVILDAKSTSEIVDKINHLFTVKGMLIALKDNNLGFYVYIPAIESLTALKASLDSLLQKITLSKKTLNGIELSTPTVNAVIYPFSTIADIFSDLHYADRQEERINIYLPHRFINIKNESLFEQSTNVNNTYKLIASLSNIKVSGGDFDAFLDKVEDPMRQAALFYDYDQAGIITYNKQKRVFVSSLAISLSDKVAPLFPKEYRIENDFVQTIENSVDPDNSVFFSERTNVHPKLGRQLDIYNISSGFIYKIIDVNGEYCGIVYFINLDKKATPLNSYLQTALMTFSCILSSYIRNHLIQEDVADVKERELNLLKLTNIRSYAIDRETYEIKSFSPSLKRDIPEIDVGQLCYKAMFGFDKPCSTCPLLSKQKAIKHIKGKDYEVSSVLNNKLGNSVELTLSGINVDPQTTNRFDKDYLINAYYSFVERLTDLYTVKARGYVVLLKIKNTDDLVDRLGNEGFSFLIRKFTKEINDRILKTNEIYKYKNDTIALIFSSLGKLDIIEAVEKIYALSKKTFIEDGNNYEFRIDYDITKYPQEHSNAEDFVRHIEYLCSKQEEEFDVDSLYIEENDFTRPASKEQYILSIITQATAAKNFIIKYQPMMDGSNRSIFGSELLIRLSDEYYNSLLNTEEVVSIAAKYGKLHNISDILIDAVGNLYEQHGASIFKPASFSRMSINADYNYFKDSDSINKIFDAMAKYNLPKEFLTFEVAEAEIAKHYDSFKEIVSSLRKNDIDIVCDRYYGDNLSFEKLKDLGITEVKSDRSLVANIDINTEKFNALAKLLESGNLLKMNMILVGVENGEQYNLIKSLNIKCNLQGYYFHHPLSPNELIEAIRADNVM